MQCTNSLRSWEWLNFWFSCLYLRARIASVCCHAQVKCWDWTNGLEHALRWALYPLHPNLLCVLYVYVCAHTCMHMHTCVEARSQLQVAFHLIFLDSLSMNPPPGSTCFHSLSLWQAPTPVLGSQRQCQHTRVLRSSFEQKALDPLSHFLGPSLSVSFQNWLSHVQRVHVYKHNWKQKPTSYELQI